MKPRKNAHPAYRQLYAACRSGVPGNGVAGGQCKCRRHPAIGLRLCRSGRIDGHQHGPHSHCRDVGASPGTAITGFPPGTAVGNIDSNDTVAIQAEVYLGSAYSYLSGLAFNTDLTGQDLGGQTLTAGVHKFDSSAALTGALTLSGPVDFIFQIGSTLATVSDAAIVTSAGANASDIYFQVGSSSTVGTGSAMQGNIVALESITMTTGSTLTGRALAINGSVTMDSNTITVTPSRVPQSRDREWSPW